jgi:2',3'-cyclic-nucleotide 2'-phosphodiesterase
MNLLFIGDIVGKAGRRAVVELVPGLKKEFDCSFCIANGENSAGGGGINAKCINHMHPLPVDVITLGDHVWDQKEFENEVDNFPNVIRPANLSKHQPGIGYNVFNHPLGGNIVVINLLGKVFVRDSAYCPFETVIDILDKFPEKVNKIFVDFHAEATSEKAAMAHFLDGKVTAVLGTHTHVQTADSKILPNGTAFITDVGMEGSENSVLGRKVDAVVRKFVTGMPKRLPVHDKETRLDAVVVSFDDNSGRANKIINISRMV